MPSLRKSLYALALCTGLLLCSPTRTQADPVAGSLNINGTFTIFFTNFDFLPPSGPPNGSFTISPASTGEFAGLAGTGGSIVDIATAPGTGQPTFVTLAANPNIQFNLTSLNPGVFSSDQCGDQPAAAGQKCTPQNTIFNFTNTSASSSVLSFFGTGTMERSTGELAPYVVVFSVQFPFFNYQQVLQSLLARASVNATYSAAFDSTVAEVPEPMTMLLLGSGLVGLTAKVKLRSRHVWINKSETCEETEGSA